MASSGTFAFSLDVDEIIQEASEPIGGEQTTGQEARSARRSINLILQDWQNRGIMLWKVDTTAVSVSTSVSSYTLTSSTLDVTEAVLRRDNTDIRLERISMEEHLKIPKKSQTGRPTQYAVRRERGAPVVHLWPIPDNTTDQVIFEQVKYFEDVNKSAVQTVDISRRFLPALTQAVSYEMAVKRPGIEGGRIQFLKTRYEDTLTRAMHEDRERSSIRILPRLNLV